MTDPSTVVNKPTFPALLLPFDPELFVFAVGWDAELGVGCAEGDGSTGVGDAGGELDSAGGTVVPELPLDSGGGTVVPELPLEPPPPEVWTCAGRAGALEMTCATIPVQLPPAASWTVRLGWNTPPPNVWVAAWPAPDAPSSNAHEKV